MLYYLLRDCADADATILIMPLLLATAMLPALVIYAFAAAA